MNRKVPEDFELRWARAVKRDRENNAHLGEIVDLFKREFQPISPLDEVFLSGVDAGIGATIFFKKESDVPECEANGTSRKMRDFVYEKLEEFGRGRRGEVKVDFEFDSLENVQKNYEGNYFLRMR